MNLDELLRILTPTLLAFSSDSILTALISALGTTAIGLLLRWLAGKVTAINDRLDEMNGKIAEHFTEDEDVQTQLREDIIYLRGRIGEPQKGRVAQRERP